VALEGFFSPQITRFPVSGPSPFNTLVVFTTWLSANVGNKYGETDNYFRYGQRIFTPLLIAGFDPSNPPASQPPFKHSSFVQFIDPGPAKNDHFLFAVDEIADAGFDLTNGTFYVDVTTAVQLPDNSIPQVQEFAVGFMAGFVITAAFRLTSFVLVNEPQNANTRSGEFGHRQWRTRFLSSLAEERARRAKDARDQKKWSPSVPFSERYKR
jgi:hypothetical protein